MKRTLMLLALILLPGSAAGQDLPWDRLNQVLPPAVAAEIGARMDEARSQGLPAGALGSLALQGVAKGRSGEEVLAAVDALLAEMEVARAALQAGGREPGEGEIEAATTAMRMGVDGATVSEAARQAPSGRSLTVPLTILGGLTSRGLPSDEALAAVRDRMAAGMNDNDLVTDLGNNGRGLGSSMRPAHAGPGMAGGRGGFQTPVAGIMVPVGPQGDRPRPGRRPGGE